MKCRYASRTEKQYYITCICRCFISTFYQRSYNESCLIKATENSEIGPVGWSTPSNVKDVASPCATFAGTNDKILHVAENYLQSKPAPYIKQTLRFFLSTGFITLNKVLHCSDISLLILGVTIRKQQTIFKAYSHFPQAF